ncbi:MAG: hypothetical protein IPO00_17230 [Betaproteobacteria bacterium]|nr:hypothetical protein [Betaproteobacteria bacterium]
MTITQARLFTNDAALTAERYGYSVNGNPDSRFQPAQPRASIELPPGDQMHYLAFPLHLPGVIPRRFEPSNPPPLPVGALAVDDDVLASLVSSSSVTKTTPLAVPGRCR